MWLKCLCYHYHLLIWRCLSNYDVIYLCAYIIKSHWNDVFLWTLWPKYLNFNQSQDVEIIRKCKASANLWAIHLRIFGNCPPTKNLHTRKSEEISALYAVEATFSNINVCLFFSAGLDVSIKCVPYDSHMKIFLSSRIAKTA